MDIYVSKSYLLLVMILWAAPTINAVWGGPIWITISLMAFFLIYIGHEWVHAYVCYLNKVTVSSIYLLTGGQSHILFEKPDSRKAIADIYLAGAVYDTILFMVSILNCLFYATLYQEYIPLLFGVSLVIITLLNLEMSGSDWNNYKHTLNSE